jgi:predicted HTH domain antitoxin
MTSTELSQPIPIPLNPSPTNAIDQAFDAYRQGQITLGKLADQLDLPIEEAKAQLAERKISFNLGVNSEEELIRDLENA